MLERILQGDSPAKIFRELISLDSSIGNSRLGEMLADEFENLTGEGRQLIWHWMGPGKSQGLTDDELDELLRDLFKRCGYFSK